MEYVNKERPGVVEENGLETPVDRRIGLKLEIELPSSFAPGQIYFANIPYPPPFSLLSHATFLPSQSREHYSSVFCLKSCETHGTTAARKLPQSRARSAELSSREVQFHSTATPSKAPRIHQASSKFHLRLNVRIESPFAN